MTKSLFKPKDSVIFAQSYLPSEPNYELYGKHGTIISSNAEESIVRFHHDNRERTVGTDELEFCFAHDAEREDYEPSWLSVDSTKPFDEFENLPQAMLITEKLYAQENDPDLDLYLSVLINQ